MQVHIQSPRITMSGGQEEFIIKKFGHLDKIYSRVQDCDVVFKIENANDKNSYIIEAKVIVPGHNLFAREAAEKFEVAADRVSADLMSQIRKTKAKLSERKGKLEALLNEDDADF